MNKNNAWDAVCIGSGITSLAFCAQVTKIDPNAKLLVLEKHVVPGGYATLFTRPRKTDAYFDCSMHKISGSQLNGGNFRRLFDEMELGRDLELIEHPDHFEACLPNKEIKLPNDPTQVHAILNKEFPHEKKGLDQYFDELLTHGKDAYYHYQIMEGSYDVDIKDLRFAHRNLKNITVSHALNERFSDGLLIEILAAATIYVGGFSEDMSYLYYLHVVYATLCKGNAYIKGSAQKLSDKLVERITANGSQVKLKENVTKITKIEDELFCIETKRVKYYAKRVYINTAPHHALNTLFKEDTELAPLRDKITSLNPANSTTTLYLVTDCPPQELGVTSSESMVLTSANEACLDARKKAHLKNEKNNFEEAFWHVGPMEITNYHTLNPEGGNVLCVNVLDKISHWPERNQPEYKEKKTKAMEIILQRLYKAKPKLRGRIIHAELATPKTYERYTNNECGSGYGALVETDSTAHNFHHFFPYKNVKFLSAWVSGSGYEAAFVYAEMMANKWQPVSDHT